MSNLYKWFLPGLKTAVQRRPWPVAVGEWTPDERPVLCQSGWHCVEERHVLGHLPRSLGAELWVVEARGTIVKDDDKIAATSLRLTERVGVTDERNLRLFAADCAQDCLHLFEERYPDDDRPRKAIEAARLYAEGQIDRTDLSAAYSAAYSVTYSAARWAAYSAADSAAYERYSNWLVIRLWEDR